MLNKKKLVINLVWNSLGQKAKRQICEDKDLESIGFTLYRRLTLDNKLEFYSYLSDEHVVKKNLMRESPHERAQTQQKDSQPAD